MIGPDDIKGLGTKEEVESFGYWVKEPDEEEQYEFDFDPRLATPLDMVKEFAEAMGQPLSVPWDFSSNHLSQENLRSKLITEEFDEFDEESMESPEKILKELADLVYVCYGYAATFGWDLDEAIRIVHESNMSKLDPDGKPIRREDGKILKGPNYFEPNLDHLVVKSVL